MRTSAMLIAFGGCAASLAVAPPAQAGIIDGVMELWNDYNKGGATMHFILALSIVAIAFTIERLLRLQRSRVLGVGLADEARQLWREGRHEELLQRCEQDDSTLARVIAAMASHPDGSLQDVKVIADDTATIEMRVHYRRLLPLTVAATVAPLLGLFGTVAGMIGAFRNFRMLGETGDPSVFAGDISLALITTAAGLIVAMPSLTAYHYFKSRTNALSDELEATTSSLAIEWFGRRGAEAAWRSRQPSAASPAAQPAVY